VIPTHRNKFFRVVGTYRGIRVTSDYRHGVRGGVGEAVRNILEVFSVLRFVDRALLRGVKMLVIDAGSTGVPVLDAPLHRCHSRVHANF
jgi:hypothetical protein